MAKSKYEVHMNRESDPVVGDILVECLIPKTHNVAWAPLTDVRIIVSDRLVFHDDLAYELTSRIMTALKEFGESYVQN